MGNALEYWRWGNARRQSALGRQAQGGLEENTAAKQPPKTHRGYSTIYIPRFLDFV